MSNESKALGLANWVEIAFMDRELSRKTADELRRQHAEIESLRAQLAARVPEDIFAWATFDGEGGYDLRLYEGNESYRDDYINRNGEKYASWVFPLSAAPSQQAPVAQDEPVAWVDPRNIKSAHVSSERGGPYDCHTWSEARTDIHQTPLYTHPQQASDPMMEISEEAAWSLAKYVYGRSQPYDAPQILLTPKELKTIIESAWNIKGKQ